ncbi:MAG: GNAT family N-acetyltransferase [Comamonadaceae bacterium]|nr:MAG: GNAT family N-acetyltransferase [Comamonadaceae bacterium]
MEIRKLQQDDAVPYRALRLRALREHPDAFTSSFEEESQKSVETSRARLAATTGNAFWGAFLPEGIVGMVGLDREQRAKNRHKATLVGMYVAPEAGKRGIGRALVEALLAEARATGVELLLLTVTHGNTTARELYARCGFNTFGIEPDAVRVGGQSYAKEHMYLRLA